MHPALALPCKNVLNNSTKQKHWFYSAFVFTYFLRDTHTHTHIYYYAYSFCYWKLVQRFICISCFQILKMKVFTQACKNKINKYYIAAGYTELQEKRIYGSKLGKYLDVLREQGRQEREGFQGLFFILFEETSNKERPK